MKFHSFLTVLFICISVIYIFYPFIIEQYDNKTLTFTNTQTWDSTLLQTIDRLTEKDKAFIQSLTIDTSPLDNTPHEIRDLINKKKKRKKKKRIKKQKKKEN